MMYESIVLQMEKLTQTIAVVFDDQSRMLKEQNDLLKEQNSILLQMLGQMKRVD